MSDTPTTTSTPRTFAVWVVLLAAAGAVFSILRIVFGNPNS